MAQLNKGMDDDYIPIDVLLTLQRNPRLFAEANAYVKCRIKRSEKQAEFIKNNRHLFRTLSDEQG